MTILGKNIWNKLRGQRTKRQQTKVAPDSLGLTALSSTTDSETNSSTGATVEGESSHGALPTGTQSDAQLRKSLWDDIMQRLPEEDKALIEKYKLTGPEDFHGTCSKLLKTCEKKRNSLKGAGWETDDNGRSIAIRSKLDRVVGWVEKLIKVGDIAVTADPIHAGLPWAAFRLLLQVVVSSSQQMEALVSGLDKVFDVIGRCKIYSSLYLQDVNESPATQQLRSSVIKLYSTILKFLIKALRLLGKEPAEMTAYAFWNLEETTEFNKKCSELEIQAEYSAENCERFFSRDIRAKSLSRMLKEFRETRASIDSIELKLTTLWKHLDEQRKLTVLEWTSQIRVKDLHRFAREGRVQGTGDWLLSHDRYQLWRSGTKSMILWLHGIPGAGKTKLISKIIDEFNFDPVSEGFAYFYCNRNESLRRQAQQVLASFVKQLAVGTDPSAVHCSLLNLYDEKKRGGWLSNMISTDESESLLIALFKAYNQTTLILDAMDECNEESQRELLKVFDRLIETGSNLRILVSSRRDEHIRAQFSKKANISIEATDNHDDIKQFVSVALEDDRRARESSGRIPIPTDLGNQISTIILDKSGGMFQWAYLQITYILALKRHSEIIERLSTLPEGLEETYNELFQLISNSVDGSAPIAVRAFQWLMCSDDIPAQALVAAVCQDPEKDEMQVVDIDVGTILDACKNLLAFDQELNRIRYAHLSVREYCERHWTIHDASTVAAKVCLSVLINYGSEIYPEMRDYFMTKDASEAKVNYKTRGVRKTKSPRIALYQYAVQHWYIYVQKHGTDQADARLSSLLLKFLGTPSRGIESYKAWYEAIAWEGRAALGSLASEPLTYASYALCLIGLNWAGS